MAEEIDSGWHVGMQDDAFDDWIRELDEDVIQGQYGYERGEFDVFPELWRPLYEKGLTPAQAFRRALDAFAEERRQAK